MNAVLIAVDFKSESEYTYYFSGIGQDGSNPIARALAFSRQSYAALHDEYPIYGTYYLTILADREAREARAKELGDIAFFDHDYAGLDMLVRVE